MAHAGMYKRVEKKMEKTIVENQVEKQLAHETKIKLCWVI